MFQRWVSESSLKILTSLIIVLKWSTTTWWCTMWPPHHILMLGWGISTSYPPSRSDRSYCCQFCFRFHLKIEWQDYYNCFQGYWRDVPERSRNTDVSQPCRLLSFLITDFWLALAHATNGPYEICVFITASYNHRHCGGPKLIFRAMRRLPRIKDHLPFWMVLLNWAFHVSLLSRITPRYFTSSE